MSVSYLNTQNIEKAHADLEYHPLNPCIDANTKVLFLGSFPPQRKRWAKGFDFFYPNFTNDHWRIMGLLFHDDKDHFVDLKNKTYKYAEIISFVKQRGIGYYDTAEVVRRLKNNASDKYLEIVINTNVQKLLTICKCCEAIITTGEKATLTLCEDFRIQTPPKVGEGVVIPNVTNGNKQNIMLHRLPSSSRAFPMPLTQKSAIYNKVISLYIPKQGAKKT